MSHTFLLFLFLLSLLLLHIPCHSLLETRHFRQDILALWVVPILGLLFTGLVFWWLAGLLLWCLCAPLPPQQQSRCRSTTVPPSPWDDRAWGATSSLSHWPHPVVKLLAASWKLSYSFTTCSYRSSFSLLSECAWHCSDPRRAPASCLLPSFPGTLASLQSRLHGQHTHES